MAYSTPFSAVAGTAWKAADWNTYGRDNLAWIATDSPACRAYNNANISIGNTSETVVTLNSERFDNASMHSTATNTSRITVPTGGGGKYMMGCGSAWTGSAGGTYRQSIVKLNAATYVGLITLAPSASHGSPGTVTTSYALSAADYIEMYVNQDSGGNLNLTVNASYSPELWAFWFRT